MRSWGTEPSPVILSQTMQSKDLKSVLRSVKTVEDKRDGVINQQYNNFN